MYHIMYIRVLYCNSILFIVMDNINNNIMSHTCFIKKLSVLDINVLIDVLA